MSGRQWHWNWHWLAAGVAGLAVIGAVLADSGTPSPSLSAHPFPTVEFHAPDNGSAVVATPTMDVTPVTKTTPKPKPPAAATSTPPPPTSHHDDHPRLTITLDLPDLSDLHLPDLDLPDLYIADCSMAKALGMAPIYRGQPGYRDELDHNHNGVACES